MDDINNYKFCGEFPPFGDDLIGNKKDFCKELPSFEVDDKCDKEKDFYSFWSNFIIITGFEENVIKYQNDYTQLKRLDYYEDYDDGDDIIREFEYMEFVGGLLKTVREKLVISAEEFANKLEIPVNFITDIEAGQYINRFGKIDALPVAASVIFDEEKEVNREWWHDCSDWDIRKKMAEYLICTINSQK